MGLKQVVCPTMYQSLTLTPVTLINLALILNVNNFAGSLNHPWQLSASQSCPLQMSEKPSWNTNPLIGPSVRWGIAWTFEPITHNKQLIQESMCSVSAGQRNLLWMISDCRRVSASSSKWNAKWNKAAGGEGAEREFEKKQKCKSANLKVQWN